MERPRLGRIVAASIIGTTIEWYDFFLYASAAALVFNRVFFAESDPLTGTMLAFLTYAVGFAARPIGALVFGHFGDRLGRKKLLALSLLLMGSATFLIGCLPSHASIGSAAPLLLTALRLVQGFALGGEWGGAVLLVSEHGSPTRRGFWASWPQAGAPAGNLLAAGMLALATGTLSDAAFASWGWRIPFLFSGVLVVIGLWIRLNVTESPTFEKALAQAEARKAAHQAEQPPLVAVVRHHWRDLLVAMGARVAENISFYVLTTFALVYCSSPAVGLDKSTALDALLVASAVHFFAIPLWGALSDRLGRRPVYLFGAVGVGLWIFAFFGLLRSGNPVVITLAITVGLVLHGAMYGPQAAFFSELFGTRMRYSGASIGSQFASLVAGAPAPLIATALLRSYHGTMPIAVYVAVAVVVTVIALLAAKETRHRSLEEEQSVNEPGEEKAAVPVI